MNKKIIIPIIFALVLVIAPLASAAFLPIKSYDKETDTVTLSNFLGLGKDYAQAQLTWGDTQVGVGIDTHVGTFTFTPLDEDAYISDLDLYEVGNGNVMTRGKQYKVLTYVKDDLFSTVCNDVWNETYGNYTQDCYQVENGTYMKEEWKPLASWLKSNSFKVGETYSIGVFVDTEEGDYGDWIPTLMSFEIDEWSTWTASLNTNIDTYYKLDETSGTNVVDSVASNDGTNTGATVGSTGKIGTAYSFGGDDYITVPAIISGTGNFTLNFWYFEPTGASRDNFDLFIRLGTAVNNNAIGVYWSDGTSFLEMGLYGSPGIQHPAPPINNWHMVTVVLTGGDTIEFFVNGTSVGSSSATSYDISASGNVSNYIGGAGSNYFVQATIDEVGVWNRELTPTEVTQLYNAGAGITYTTSFDNSPTATLYSPIDEYNSTSQTNDLTWNATDDFNIVNVSLIVGNAYIFTNSSPTNATAQTYNYDFGADGTFAWKIEACDNASQCTNSSARNINIDTTPFIELTNPTQVNEYNDSSGYLPINVSLTETYFQNITWNINGDTFTYTNSTRFVNLSLADGTYEYNVTTGTTTGQLNTTETRTINIDTVAPIIEITQPSSTIQFSYAGEIINVNFTLIEDNPDSCWYDYNGTNITIPSCENFTIGMEENNYNITIWANDTFGFVNSSTRTWSVALFEQGTSANYNVTETNNETFYINFTIPTSVLSVSVFLNYNGTDYIADGSCPSTNCSFDSTIDIPLIDDNVKFENKTYFWKLTTFNSTGTGTSNTSTQYQNVSLVNFTSSCSAGQARAVNYTFNDESTGNLMTLEQAKVSFNYYLGTGTVYRITNQTLTNTQFQTYCIEPNATYTVDATMYLENKSGNYANRKYDLVKQLYNNISTYKQQLWLLNYSLATPIIIQVQDSGLAPKSGITVNVSRFFPELGKYVMIGSQISDELGNVVEKMVQSDIKYRMTFLSPNNQILKISNDFTVACISSPCVIPFVLEDDVDDFGRFDNLTSYDGSLTYDNTTNTVVYSWSDQRGESARTRLEVTRYLLNSSTVVCNLTSTSLLSSLSCSIGDASASYKAQVFRLYGGEENRISILNFKVGDTASIYGVEGLLWVFILLGTVIGIGAFNPTAGVVLYGVGFIFFGMMGIISMPLPVFFANTIICILFIWGFKSR